MALLGVFWVFLKPKSLFGLIWMEAGPESLQLDFALKQSCKILFFALHTYVNMYVNFVKTG